MYALMWSGGKDSCLALARARRQGLAVETLVNFYDAATGRVRFHATRRELAKLAAAWLGRPVDEALATDLARLPDVDPCGERGEYHTFVYGGPLFSVPILWRPGPIHEQDGFAQLELLPR